MIIAAIIILDWYQYTIYIYTILHARATGWLTVPSLARSNRTVSARRVNGQGAMNEHTGDGMVYLYLLRPILV